MNSSIVNVIIIQLQESGMNSLKSKLKLIFYSVTLVGFFQETLCGERGGGVEHNLNVSLSNQVLEWSPVCSCGKKRLIKIVRVRTQKIYVL